MNLSKTMGLAFSSIRANKMRSFLTMLGIIIGVAAVIILVSIMDGITGEVSNAFESFGMNNITVMITPRGGTRYVEPDDLYELVDKNPELYAYCSPKVTTTANIKSPDSSESKNASITGVDETYDDIDDLATTQGRFLQYVDIDKMLKVCVIGTYYEREYYGSGKALDKTIKINGEPYTIVGVLEEKTDSSEGSTDQCIYIPYTNASKMSWNSNISNYVVAMNDANDMDRAKAVLERKLTEILGNSNYYNLIATQEILDEMNKLMDTLKGALVLIAGISLLVGGIGIMNIMLVSVTERTKEIGIRKSLGARKRHIMQQFVIEAGTVSGIGGVVGIIVGAILAFVVGKFLNITVLPSVSAIVLAFSVSVGIGIIFGFLPAKNAANLNPIDALRFE